MAAKKSQDIDQQIILALANGEPNKDIAKRLGVSPSYVSKVKTGKKIPSLKIVEPTLIKDEFFTIDNNDMTDILIMLNDKSLIVDKFDIVEYLEVQMKKSLIRAKMFQLLLNKYKGEK